jgi:hypothetical protein
MYNRIGLQFSQLLDQHLFADSSHDPFQFAKATRRVEIPENDHLPSPTDNVKGRLQSARIGTWRWRARLDSNQ